LVVRKLIKADRVLLAGQPKDALRSSTHPMILPLI